MADFVIPGPGLLNQSPPDIGLLPKAMKVLDSIRLQNVLRGIMGNQYMQSLPSPAHAGKAALEYLSPAGDVLDMQHGAQQAGQAVVNRDPLGFLGGLGTAALGLAGTVVPGRPAIATRDIADRVARYAERLGYQVRRDGSNQSKSQYLIVDHPDLPDEPSIKIRVADHELPPSYGSGGDYEVGPHGSGHFEGWAGVVEALAQRAGRPMPPRAASELTKLREARAADEAARRAAAERNAAMLAESRESRSAARERIAADPELAARLAEIEARLADPSLTGNKRKKWKQKERDLYARALMSLSPTKS